MPSFDGGPAATPPAVIGSQDVTSGASNGANGNGANGANGAGPTVSDTPANGVQAPDSADGSGPVTVPPSAAPEPRLPIFDSLESDWFRASGKPLPAAPPSLAGRGELAGQGELAGRGGG